MHTVKPFDPLKTFKKVENLLLEATQNGYCMFVNDGTVQFFKGANPPRNKWGMVEEQKALYSCDIRICADGGATL